MRYGREKLAVGPALELPRDMSAIPREFALSLFCASGCGELKNEDAIRKVMWPGQPSLSLALQA